MSTHEVVNQVPPLVGHDAADDPVLVEALLRAGVGDDALAGLAAVGRAVGSAEVQELGDRAERHPPVLHTHDRYGYRVDRVDYDPAYHELMRRAVGHGLHSAAWADPRPQAHLIRAALFGVWFLADPGHCCPISMTYSVVPALRADPDLASRYAAGLASRVYDPAPSDPAGKAGLIAGMSMTEKQGGSDVRANTTRAHPQPDGSYRITGHKWFTSAPMSDLLLVLAQAPGGLTCFVVPRVLPDGSPNGIRLLRLKDKLGNRSNASAEVEYDDAVGWRLGEEGRGVRVIIEMVGATRLDCVLAAAAMMRHGVRQAAHHARHRVAFGAPLIEAPAMRNVIADLAVEAEAATLVSLWLADLTDRVETGDEGAAVLRRLVVAACKYQVCKRGPTHAAEALECLGGNGYVEDSRMPRLYREAPLVSIWEGSGNVAALDVLRALATDSRSLPALVEDLAAAAGADRRLDAAAARLTGQLAEAAASTRQDRAVAEFGARRLAGDLAAVVQASLLVRFGDPAVADAYLATRLADDRGSEFGTLPAGVDGARILARTPGLR